MTRDGNATRDTDTTRDEDATRDGNATRQDSAIVVTRTAEEPPDTTEITGLAEAAGYEVVEAHTQRRPPDGGYQVGRGKAEELGRRLAATGAGAVVFDNPLTPGQYRNLVGLFPDGTRVLDRHWLVLEIFGERAGDRVARLQVELAQIRYELPRVKATEERTHLQEAAETGSRLVDLERRERTVQRNLTEARETAAERRRQRRDQGFDLVAIAGYTNAGKSTLLHRLADDLSVASMEPEHADLDGVAEVEDRLFKTLETTTRRGDIAGRPVMLTDTVGLIDGIPHDLVASFSSTLETVADADVALLVVDAADPVDELRTKVEVSLAELEAPRGELVAALNKVDLLDDDAVEARREAIAEVVPGGTPVVPVSTIEGTGVEDLREVVADGLPGDRAEFDLPNDGATQSFLAWAHDRGDVDVAYEGGRVAVAFEGRPSVVEEARRRAADVAGEAVADSG